MGLNYNSSASNNHFLVQSMFIEYNNSNSFEHLLNVRY